MKNYERSLSCEKCGMSGTDKISIKYKKAITKEDAEYINKVFFLIPTPAVETIEHLELECVCGYNWKMKCMDNKIRNNYSNSMLEVKEFIEKTDMITRKEIWNYLQEGYCKYCGISTLENKCYCEKPEANHDPK